MSMNPSLVARKSAHNDGGKITVGLMTIIGELLTVY